MRAKALILVLICLLLTVCEKSPQSPFSPPIKDSTQLEFKMSIFTNGEDIMLTPPNDLWPVWEAIFELHVDNRCIGEIATHFVLGTTTVKNFTPSTSYQVNKNYAVKYRFKDTDIPAEWQEQIGFQINLKVRAIDEDFMIEGEDLGWQEIYTEYFIGWIVGEWMEYYIRTSRPYTFRILRR